MCRPAIPGYDLVKGLILGRYGYVEGSLVRTFSVTRTVLLSNIDEEIYGVSSLPNRRMV